MRPLQGRDAVARFFLRLVFAAESRSQSKCSECATELDGSLRSARHCHGRGDDQHCEYNCFADEIAPGFLLKVLTADIAKRWHRRFRATATISPERHGMVIAVSQRETLLAASAHGCRFHTSLRCVAGSCWIQKFLGLATSVAMSVPTTTNKSHDSVFQELTVINRKQRRSHYSASGTRSSRFRDVYRDRTCATAAVAATLLRPCRCAGSLALMNLRALRQFDGSAGDQFQSRRAWS